MGIFDVYPDLRDAALTGEGVEACRKPTLILAMTPRTGSTHLAALLAGPGRMAAANEIFNLRGVAQGEMERRRATDFSGMMRAVNADPYPWYGFKTCFGDFAPVAGFYRKLFPDARFVYLSRRHVFRQGISYFRACVSGEWHGEAGVARDEAAEEAARAELRGKFNLPAYWGSLKVLTEEARAWRAFFEAEGIAPLEIFYEDIGADVEGVLRRIGALTGMDFLPAAPPKFRQLADGLSEEWLRLVLADLRVS